MQDKSHPLGNRCILIPFHSSPHYQSSPDKGERWEGKNPGPSINDWTRTAIQNTTITSDVKNYLPEKLIVLNPQNMSICLVCVPLGNKPSMWWDAYEDGWQERKEFKNFR